MSEQFPSPEMQTGEIVGAHINVDPDHLESVKGQIMHQREVLQAQRVFAAAAFALKQVTEYLPESFDQVVDPITSQAESYGRNLPDIELMAVIDTEDGKRLVEGNEGVGIKAYNPDQPNRVIIRGYDFSSRETEEDPRPVNQFWALADLDNIGAKLELHVLPYAANTSSEQIMTKLYEQLYAE